MQFKLAKTYRYWWPVTVRIPDPAAPGEIIEQKFQVELQPMPQDEWLASQEESAKITTLRGVTEHGVSQIKRIVTNWDGVVDDDARPVPYSTEGLEMALQHAWFRAAIQKALADSQNGEAAREGN
jgi:hypothetical protein